MENNALRIQRGGAERCFEAGLRGGAERCFEAGLRVERGAVKVIDLRGTWREMGRQYGALLSDELGDICAFVDRIAAASAENAVRADEISLALARQMPHNVRKFFAGAAETSGLTLPRLYRANAVEYIAGLPQCSAMAAWGESARGPLVFGRNYDYGEVFLRIARDVAVTVFHPADGSQAVAIIGYAGEIYAVNGMNASGVFLELNNGTPSTRMEMTFSRAQGTTCLFDALFKADSLDDLDIFFETTVCSDSYIINVADAREARSYEWCPIGARRADTPNGLLISTNHYVHPDWNFPVPTDAESWDSLARRARLMAFAEENRGQMDAAGMRALFDLRFEDGGVTDELTMYQMVVVPETGTLWLKITAASDWTEIDLGSFLQDNY